MYIKPVRATPDPERGGYLDEAGRHVQATPYWMRRLQDGDVEEVDPPPAQSAATTTESPPSAGSSVSETSSSTKTTRSKGPQQ